MNVGIIDVTLNNHKKHAHIHWIDLSALNDHYVARVGFFPDHCLALQFETRAQTKLHLYQCDFLNGQPLKLLVEDRSDSWINLHDLFHPLKQTPGQFVWASERTGYMHLEVRDYQTGQLTKTLTSGAWVVQRIVDIDEGNSTIYFMANRETPLEIHLYSVNYAEELSRVERITQEAGCHIVHCFNHTYQYCVTQWNSIDQCPTIRMLDVKTRTVFKSLDHMQYRLGDLLEPFHFVKPKLFPIANRNNDTLYCALYTPDDEHRRHQTPYPTLVSVYGGPHLQR